jgi:hypothetical protein
VKWEGRGTSYCYRYASIQLACYETTVDKFRAAIRAKAWGLQDPIQDVFTASRNSAVYYVDRMEMIGCKSLVSILLSTATKGFKFGEGVAVSWASCSTLCSLPRLMVTPSCKSRFFFFFFWCPFLFFLSTTVFKENLSKRIKTNRNEQIRLYAVECDHAVLRGAGCDDARSCAASFCSSDCESYPHH